MNYAERINTWHWSHPTPDERYESTKLTATWRLQHQAAVGSPNQHESGVVRMIAGWLDYADEHRRQYTSGIGEDGVLGPDWAALGAAIRGLLNSDLGRLDRGTLDSIIYETLIDEGFDPDRV